MAPLCHYFRTGLADMARRESTRLESTSWSTRSFFEFAQSSHLPFDYAHGSTLFTAVSLSNGKRESSETNRGLDCAEEPCQSKVDLALYDTGRGAKALRGSFQVLFLYDVSDQLRLTELASGAEARAGARVPVLGLQPARVTRRRADIIIVPTGVFQNCSKIL